MKTLEPENYEITLLTTKEYKKFKKHIPNIRDWWWLRSPGGDEGHAAYVCPQGAVLSKGDGVRSIDDAVRPALKSDEITLAEEEQFAAFGNRWTVIAKGVAISNGIIATIRYDDNSNIWETSEIKAWLEKWVVE